MRWKYAVPKSLRALFYFENQHLKSQYLDHIFVHHYKEKYFTYYYHLKHIFVQWVLLLLVVLKSMSYISNLRSNEEKLACRYDFQFAMSILDSCPARVNNSIKEILQFSLSLHLPTLYKNPNSYYITYHDIHFIIQ